MCPSKSPKFAAALVLAALAVLQFAPRAYADPSQSQSQCITGGDGRAACGYDCKVGGDGRAACSSVPNGTCVVGGDGQTVCYAPRFLPAPGSPQTMCVVGGDGHGACGYDCKVGGDGRAACSPVPEGKCAVGGDGRAVCFDPGGC